MIVSRGSWWIPARTATFGLFFVVACATFDPSVRRGDELAAEGRWNEALREYEAAADRSPRDRRVQERLEHARTEVAIDLVRLSDEALGIRRFDRAEALILDALELDPDGEAPRAGRARLASAWAEEATALFEEDEDVERAWRAVERAAELDVDAPGVRSARNRLRDAYLEHLRAQADALQAEGRGAAALVALVRLARLDRRNASVLDGRIAELRRWIHGRSGFVLELRRIAGPTRRLRPGARLVSERLSALLPPDGCPNLMVVQRAQEGPGISMSGRVTAFGFENRDNQRTEIHTYQSGTRTVPNPDWPRKKATLEQAQSDLETAIEEVQDLMREVARREVEVVESGPGDDVAARRRSLEETRANLERARADAQAKSQDLAEAQKAFDETPETLEEPVMTDGELVVTEAERIFEVGLALDVRDIASGEVVWEGSPFEASTSTETEHHRGLRAAGIEPVPRAFPEDDDALREEALSSLVASVREGVGELCNAHRDMLRDQGLALAREDVLSATEWLVMAIFFDPFGELAAWDDDGRVADFFRRAWGIDDLAAILGD